MSLESLLRQESVLHKNAYHMQCSISTRGEGHVTTCILGGGSNRLVRLPIGGNWCGVVALVSKTGELHLVVALR